MLINIDDEYDFRGEEQPITCVVCGKILPEDSNGLCEDHQYDEEVKRES